MEKKNKWNGTCFTKCFMTLMERRDDGIWECPKCHTKKIPKDIWDSEKLIHSFFF